MRDVWKIQADWVNRFKSDLVRDKRKTSVLLVLIAVAGIMAGRLLLTDGPPQRAQAAPSSPPALGSGRVPAGDLSKFGGHPTDVIEAPGKITRDLFRVNTHLFPSPGSGAVAETVASSGTATEEEIQRMGVRAQAQTLDLQSTIVGDSPAAIINGRVIRRGESIGDFRVIEVGPRSCVVERDGVRVRLEMKNWDVSQDDEIDGMS